MNKITVEVSVDAPVGTVWEYWSKPAHITRRAYVSEDWEAPEARDFVYIA